MKKFEFEFVYVNDDGSARELSILEKLYLRTQYRGADGGRPYIKRKYLSKDGWGNQSGYCFRKLIPKTIIVRPNISEVTAEEIENQIKSINDMGYKINFSGIEDECNNTH